MICSSKPDKKKRELIVKLRRAIYGIGYYHRYVSIDMISFYTDCTNFCNQGGITKTDLSPSPVQSQSARAASLTYNYMKFYLLIENRTVCCVLLYAGISKVGELSIQGPLLETKNLEEPRTMLK